jgi:hypothetical protein
MLFSLPNNTECVLTTFVGRTQKSGPDDVPAVTFRLKMASVSNMLLDLFSKTIRHTVYRAVEGQEQLPGMEDTTPILQSKDLTEWSPDTCLEGWRVIVARGGNDDSALQMGSCKVDDFRFSFFDGGHMDVDFRISTADVDEAGAGMLWGRQKRNVFVMITAPEAPTAKAAIDGSVEAFKKDHPEFKDGANPDAGDLFAEQHGGGPIDGIVGSASDQHAGDFGQADEDSAGPGAGSSDDAPFGEPQTGDEPNWPTGDTPAEDGDAAAFEAGAAAAIAKAGVAPRGRRGRKVTGVVE